MHRVLTAYVITSPFCSLTDTTIPDCVKAAEFPQIGEAYRIDLTINRILAGDKYLIRIKQNGKKFEIVEVILAGKSKEYIFDCLNLERYLCTVFKCIGGNAAQCMYVWVYI